MTESRINQGLRPFFSVGDTANLSFSYDLDAIDRDPRFPNPGEFLITDFQGDIAGRPIASEDGAILSFPSIPLVRVVVGPPRDNVSVIPVLSTDVVETELFSAGLRFEDLPPFDGDAPTLDEITTRVGTFNLIFGTLIDPISLVVRQTSLEAELNPDGIIDVTWRGFIPNSPSSPMLPVELEDTLERGDEAVITFSYDPNAPDQGTFDNDGIFPISDYDIKIGDYEATATGGEFFYSSDTFATAGTNAQNYELDGTPISQPVAEDLPFFSANLAWEVDAENLSDLLEVSLDGLEQADTASLEIIYGRLLGQDTQTVLFDATSFEIEVMDDQLPLIPLPAGVWLLLTALTPFAARTVFRRRLMVSASAASSA
ncbi:MAG: VPLPA-CTERM sorting domain-containing protein [Pseudomonadota bacterium]